MLKKGIHDNLYLRKSFNKHGLENFVFEILELCTEKDLILKENYYNNNYKSNEMSFGYNLALVGNSRRNIVSNSVKLKLSKFNQQKNNNFSKYSLTNIESTEIFIFESLIDDTNYLISYGFVKGKSKNVRMVISNCLRGRKVDNGGKGTILK
jgi:group I intron endonuclease